MISALVNLFRSKNLLVQAKEQVLKMLKIVDSLFDDSVNLFWTGKGVTIDEIRKREPLLRDNLITFFTAQPLEVLTNIRYRQAIRSRVKKILDYHLGEGAITRVFFSKWVFQ